MSYKNTIDQKLFQLIKYSLVLSKALMVSDKIFYGDASTPATCESSLRTLPTFQKQQDL